jgi:hypothetical protein
MEVIARSMALVCSWQVRTSLVAAEDPSTVVFKKKNPKKILADNEASHRAVLFSTLIDTNHVAS